MIPIKKWLLLIHPVNDRFDSVTVMSSAGFPPLGLGYVAALTPDDWEIELVDENWERFQYREADLVALTAYTGNATRAYRIATAYRERGVPTVMGGMHASILPDEAAQFVDTVAVGEAECTWPQINDAE